MYIAYFDETGDDGYPKYSSDHFVITSIYMHHENWKVNYQKMVKLRTNLKNDYNIPVKYEVHTKQLLLNKNPFRDLNLSDETRLKVAFDIAHSISNLIAQVVNVCIDKNMINEKNIKRYGDILDTSLSFNIQRIENDLRKKDAGTKFLIITDEGRVGKMTKTTRKIQVVNFIPSKYSQINYREEIKLLIEDPLPKNSKESFFIQIADFISYFVFLKCLGKDRWGNRLQWLDESNVDKILEVISPILNLSANASDKCGIVKYPK